MVEAFGVVLVLCTGLLLLFCCRFLIERASAVVMVWVALGHAAVLYIADGEGVPQARHSSVLTESSGYRSTWELTGTSCSKQGVICMVCEEGGLAGSCCCCSRVCHKCWPGLLRSCAGGGIVGLGFCAVAGLLYLLCFFLLAAILLIMQLHGGLTCLLLFGHQLAQHWLRMESRWLRMCKQWLGPCLQMVEDVYAVVGSLLGRQSAAAWSDFKMRMAGLYVFKGFLRAQSLIAGPLECDVCCVVCCAAMHGVMSV